MKRYNVWRYNWQDSLEKRMPWLGARSGLLTTSTHSDYSEWGTIISEKTSNNPAPWIYGVMTNPGLIWYWMNEGKIDKKPTPGKYIRIMNITSKFATDCLEIIWKINPLTPIVSIHYTANR